MAGLNFLSNFRECLMRKRFFILFTVILALNSVAGIYSDIDIIESNEKYIIFDWHPQGLEVTSTGDAATGIRHFLNMKEANHAEPPGAPDIPGRIVTLGVPDTGSVYIDILEQQQTTYRNIDLQPVPYPSKGNIGISENIYQQDEQFYDAGLFYPERPVQKLRAGHLRDIPVIRLKMHAARYNPVSRELAVFDKIRIRVSYGTSRSEAGIFRKRGKLDNLYKDILLNFPTASKWQTAPSPRLAKPAELPGGKWYRIRVSEDGVYKITASTLSSNGISLSGITAGALRMFNNGGHKLSPRTTAEFYNPAYTSEIPIIVFDENNNDLFDNADYILFYGKHVNGWFYDENRNEFNHHQHPYATENIYWLNLSGADGMRMDPGDLSGQPGAVQMDYYMERFHFEEDLYNLLASGPDWYGKRFFGRSGNWQKNFDLKASDIPGVPASFRMRLKGGSGITYGDYTRYLYEFTMYLNGQLAYSSSSSHTPFVSAARRDIFKEFPDNAFLNNGTNSLEVQYTGNDDACNVYIDWFEVHYPRTLRAEGDQISFYTDNTQNALRYAISGFSDAGNIYVFDVSNPVAPILLDAGLSAQNGTLTIDLPASDQNRHIFVTSLSSTNIKSIATLTPYEPGDNLLDTGNAADFLIITHKSFRSYAEELAEMRRTRPVNPLKTKVVTTEDIFFQFNSGMQDPTAIRNFIRYAYHNWTSPTPSYVLLFGDGHYDYRNIALSDTNRVPPFEIYAADEVNSRTVDNYFVQLDLNYDTLSSIDPDLAIGRLPMESKIDCERYLQKLKSYEGAPSRDGWQTTMTFVADDEITSRSENEWMHQSQTEDLATLFVLKKFIKKKVYLSAYPAVPGGLRYLKPRAAEDIIDYINQGTLVINYVGHGSPTSWAHETVFNLSRDLNKINNEGRLAFLIAATCDFGKYDDPHEPSFTEALIWKEQSGVIGVLAAARLVYSQSNFLFVKRFYENLFASRNASSPLGDAMYLASLAGVNDQKYHLFADPTMYLADPRQELEITSVSPDTLKALSRVEVTARVLSNEGSSVNAQFEGGAMLIVNDARYDSVNTGGGRYYILDGPLVFKGEVSVEGGELNGSFIVPKSIRYADRPTGKLTIFAWDDDTRETALGYNENLLLSGSVTGVKDSDGPDIDIYFEDQENFTTGDLIRANPVLIAELSDDNGINMTGETGYKILLQIDDETPKNVSGFFSYERDKFDRGFIRYPMEEADPGEHALKLSAFDNLNNQSESEIAFQIASTAGLALDEVVNYPNPFRSRTDFTFQTNRGGAEASVRIYTISGRLIQEIVGYYTLMGYNQIPWDGRDRDGDRLGNGVYLYKIILESDGEKVEKIEKMVVIN